MSRTERAIGHVDLDYFAQSRGFQSAAHEIEMKRLYRQVGAGEWPGRDIERIHATYYRAIPSAFWERITAHVRGGAGNRDRAERLANCTLGAVDLTTGIPVQPLPQSVHEQVRHECEQFAVQEYAMPLTQQLNESDSSRDKGRGIDERSRVAQAQRAAMVNPEAERKSEVEKAWSHHTGGEPTLYSGDRREIYAQHADYNVERIRKQMVRDADPNRLPDRGDDRRADIELQYDKHALEPLVRDELALRDNPLLEATDNALTHAASMSE